MFAPMLDQSAVKLAFPNTDTIPDSGAGFLVGFWDMDLFFGSVGEKLQKM